MPYIKHAAREKVDTWIFELSNRLPFHDAGVLNYCISRLVISWLGPDPHYEDIALATGVLENVKQELYRRLAGPYEDRKALENGDLPGYMSVIE